MNIVEVKNLSKKYNNLEVIKDISFNRRILFMAYKITDACIACGACAAECPVEAISEGENIYVIDADTCIDCGSCADTCPVDAPVEA